MTLTDVELATIRIVLAALENDPDATVPARDLNAILGPTWARRIAERRAEFVAANKAVIEGLLSVSALDYWREARAVLSYGRLVLSMGSRKAEKTLSLKCEALDESFPQRVNLVEQGFFLIYDDCGANWDDRWHACVDFCFPILRPELIGQTVVANPLREAQIEILAEALAPPAGNIADASPTTFTGPTAGQRLRALARRD